MERDIEFRERHLARAPLAAGRIGTYTALGAVGATVPLPWVPDAVTRRIRGAMLHDMAARQGLSLTPEARAILAHGVDGSEEMKWVAQGVRYIARVVLSRYGPLALIQPVRSGVATYVLGHLFHRYLETVRTDRAVRIDVEEARRIRRAIDGALIHMVTGPVQTPRETFAVPPEDLRDGTTRVIDGALLALASVPGWLTRRLEAAFDDVFARMQP